MDNPALETLCLAYIFLEVAYWQPMDMTNVIFIVANRQFLDKPCD